MKFWSKKSEHMIDEDKDVRKDEGALLELSDDLLAQIAGGAGKGACHTASTEI